MKNEKLIAELSARTGIKKITMFVLLSSIATNFLLAVVLAFKTNTHEVILTPPEVRRTLTVSNVAFSKEYLEEIAAYNVYLLLNATPQNVGFQHAQLLKFTAPEYKDALEKELNQTTLFLRRNNLTTYFSSISAAANTNDNTVTVKGTFTAQKNEQIIEAKSRSLLISYRNTNGTLELLSIKEVKDNTVAPRDDKAMEQYKLDNPEPTGVQKEEQTTTVETKNFKGGPVQ